MSEISAEEKRRLLRERRLAKMQKGKATERLNNILNQGSSTGHATVVSVLEKGETGTISEKPDFSADTPLHDDPEVPDISLLLHQDQEPDPADQDMDAILNQILGATSGNKRGEDGGSVGMQNPFADMMKAMMEGQGLGQGLGQDDSQFSAEDHSYQNELTEFHAYEQKKWKARFLVIRLVVHLFTFYHYYSTYSSFRASVGGRLLSMSGQSTNFFSIFLTIEIAIISSYFAVLSQKGLLQAFSRNHILSKIQSMGATFLPQIAKYRPLVDTALVYWGGVSIFIEDVMLLVVLFGLTTLIN